MNNRLAIEGELTVFTAHDMKTRLLDAMPPQGDLALDLREVSEFDGAGLQLLLSARHEAEQRGGTVRLTSLSDPVAAVLQLAGLLHHFDASETGTLEVTP
jgi:anti-sigma B factor antagonist